MGFSRPGRVYPRLTKTLIFSARFSAFDFQDVSKTLKKFYFRLYQYTLFSNFFNHNNFKSFSLWILKRIKLKNRVKNRVVEKSCKPIGMRLRQKVVSLFYIESLIGESLTMTPLQKPNSEVL